MADLTLRRVKNAPLTHNELDDNFLALDSDIRAGKFDSGLSVSGGIVVDPGDVEIIDGNLILNNGDIHYNPKLGFFDLTANQETMRIDSNGSFLIGSTLNSQSVNHKVSRVGSQHTLAGSKTSVSGQTTRMELGPAADGLETGAGLLATQATTNFNDWSLDIFVSNSADGYVNAISIDQSGETTFNNKVIFNDSAEFTKGINISGGNIIYQGSPLPIINSTTDLPEGINLYYTQARFDSALAAAGSGTGTVTSVASSMPTGFTTTGSPITTSGTITVGYASSHSLGLPTDVKQGEWSEAYGWGDHSTAGYVAGTRSISTANGIQGGGNLSANRTLSMTGSYTGDFTVTGNINASQDVIAFYNTSDERLKKDITPIVDALDKVSQLNGVDFEYITSGVQSTGLIAQDVKKVSPTAVFDDEDGYMGVRYQVLTGLLVEAIKELRSEIEELKKN